MRPNTRWMTNAEVERVERVLDRLADRGGPPPTQAEWDLIDRALGELGAKRALVGRLQRRGPELSRRGVVECVYCGRPKMGNKIEHVTNCAWLDIEQA